MSHYGGKQLAEGFRTVRKNTITIARDIPEDKYDFCAAPEVRSVGVLLTHIALANAFQYQIHAEERRTTLAGFDFPTLMQRLHTEEKIKRSKDQTIELLQSSGDKIGSWMESLSDEFLAEQVAMPPGMNPSARSRIEMISSMKEHEMHHRGQLMLIERILGIVPHLTRDMQARMAAGAAQARA